MNLGQYTAEWSCLLTREAQSIRDTREIPRPA
jgi:hypothetical protein